jgi:hypothetical protein
MIKNCIVKNRGKRESYRNKYIKNLQYKNKEDKDRIGISNIYMSNYKKS